MMTRTRTELKALLVLILVFIFGAISGGALTSAYYLRRPPFQHRGRGEDFFERMRRELNLTDAQAAQIQLIVNDTRNEFRSLREETRPRYDALLEKERGRIRAVLTPEQQQRFDEMSERFDTMREQHRRGNHR